MFTAVVTQLVGSSQASVLGDHLHGWLMSTLSSTPALSARLHAPVRGKPFSIWFGPASADGSHQNQHWLRLSSVDDELSRALRSLAPASIRLGASTFECRRIFSGSDHALTGETTPEAMWRQWMQGPTPRGRVRLKFLSPTAFAKGRASTTLLPVSDLVFRSLAKTWNENAGMNIDGDAVADLLTSVQEEAVDVRTTPPLSFQTHRLKGFVGECEYSCGSKASERSKRLLHLLADFSFYSGVGLKRTMGMGQVAPTRV